MSRIHAGAMKVQQAIIERKGTIDSFTQSIIDMPNHGIPGLEAILRRILVTCGELKRGSEQVEREFIEFLRQI